MTGVQTCALPILTTCLLARSHLRQLNLDKSHELFAPLADTENPYLWLQGESLNGLAELNQLKALPEQAIYAYQSALSFAGQIGNANQLVTNSGTVARIYKELGNWEQSLVYQQQAIQSISQKPTSHQQHWETNTQAADQLFSRGFYAAALAYQQEALTIELTTKRPLQLSRTYTYLGVMLGKVMRFAEAIPLTQEAVNIGVRLGNENLGIEIQAYSGLLLADLHRESGNYLLAFQGYEQVINLNSRLGIAKYDFKAYRGKALAEIALGQTELAKQDLAQALAIFEQNRNQIVADTERATYLDKEYEIYDAAISLAYAENPQAAFDLSERGRALTLLEVLNGEPTVNVKMTGRGFATADRSQPATLQTVQQRIPPGTSLLEFTCLPDRLIIFGVSAKGFTQSQNVISLPQLEQKVQAFRARISEFSSAEDDQTKVLAAELYQILIEPLDSFLSASQAVCVVPDKVLHHLPFAALFSARQQKYLIEDYALITAPSASVFLLCLDRARHQGLRKNGRVLAVGNPQFDPIAYPQLSDLSAATDEANRVAVNYSHHDVLTAEHATEEAVRAEMKHAQILHFATHGVIDKRSWANSRLVLAKPVDGDGDGALRAYEIAQMRLPNARLVVLSACQSGVERVYRGEGMIGLSRAFLSAGAPSIVASFWAVDSDVSAVLMTDFHKQLKTYSVSQALRQAQLKMLSSSDLQHRHPYYWAAFSTFGADVSL